MYDIAVYNYCTRKKPEVAIMEKGIVINIDAFLVIVIIRPISFRRALEANDYENTQVLHIYTRIHA